MNIIGLDVGRLNVVGCRLVDRPKIPRDFYRSGDFFSLKLTRQNIHWLIEQQKPDMVVLEPTGTHYSRPWVEPLINAGIEIRLVGHNQLRSYRIFLDLPEKNDKADALALACYGFDYFGEPLRFVPVRPPEVARIRDISLRLGFYTRLRVQLTNRLKQDLHEAIPSMATYRSGKLPCGNPPPFWRWLAGESVGKAKEKKYQDELDFSGGLGLTSDLAADSEILLRIFRREQSLEIELKYLLMQDCFAEYLTVFQHFGFGLRTSGIFLSQIFPIEKFQQPEDNGNFRLPTRRFRSMMGLAPRESSSGAKIKKYKSGNRLCRRTWWQWCLTTVEPKKQRKTDLLEKIGERTDLLKAQGGAIQKIRIKICGKACDLLFKALCESVH